MNIQFDRVIIDGFMSFDHEEFDLQDLGIVQLYGKNQFESLSSSNGSGKSAIFESILWVLTGSTSRGATDICNSILGKGAYVELDFSIDEIQYKVTRSKNHQDLGTSLKIIKNDQDISGNTFTKSKDILAIELGSSLDYDTLTSIIILSQGLPDRLSSLKPSSRKSRLEELSKTDQYLEDLQDKLSSATSDINSKINDINSKIIEYTAIINSSQFNINSSISKIEDTKNRLMNSIDEDTAKMYESKSKEIESSISKMDSELSEIRVNISNLNLEISQLNSEYNLRRNDNEKLINQYTSISNSRCPTCGQLLSDPSSIENLKSKVEKDILDNKTRLIEVSKLIEEKKSELIKLNESSDTISTARKDSKSELDNYITSLSNYKSCKDSTKYLEESIKENQKIIDENKLKIEDLNKSLKAESDKLSIASYFKSQLSRKFRSFLLEGVITYMNERSKDYSKYLFENQGSVSLEVDGNNINIYLGDRRFENLSGGEGRRVDIILQLIQRDLARNESGFNSSLLVLDEILDNLDSLGAESVLKLLEYKSPDINSLIIVSHKQDITIPSDRKITVVKGKDQVSHILKGV